MCSQGYTIKLRSPYPSFHHLEEFHVQRTDFQLIESLDEVVLLKTHNSSNHVAGFRQQMKASSYKKKKVRLEHSRLSRVLKGKRHVVLPY